MLKKEFLLKNKEEVIQLYITENRTVKEVAEQFNCSTAVLQRFMKDQNISKRKQTKLEDLPSKESIESLIKEGLEMSEICKKLNINNSQLCKVLEIEKYSNKIDESLLDEYSPILWYLLGLICSDGHNNVGNSIDIFQKDGTFLNDLRKMLKHAGTLYKNGDGYILRINSPKLTQIMDQYLISSDKRYSVPYIKAPNISLESCFVRGLFDGDGCIYYNYVSGVFQNMRMEITTGSEAMKNGLDNLYSRLGLHYTINERTSKVGNIYYVIYVRTIRDIKDFGNWIYSNDFKFKLASKYKKYIKFLKILEIENQVDDIVDTN